MVEKHDIGYLTDHVIDIYKTIHQEPELGFEEEKTSALICRELESYGLMPKRVMLTGVLATIEGTKPGDGSKGIALRADIDALPFTEESGVPFASRVPGRMHACGHDAHTSMLLGAARYLAEHRDLFSGKVRLIFQPAEEGWEPELTEKVLAAGGSELGGAASMIKAGALEGVQMCQVIHVDPMMATGKMCTWRGPCQAAADQYRLRVIGKGGHGAVPEWAVDPMQAAASIVLGFSALPAREYSALDQCVVSVGSINTNSTWNNIPEYVDLTGTTRCFDADIRERTIDRLKAMAQSIAEAYRCTTEFTRIPDFAATINTDEGTDLMLQVAGEMLGPENISIARPSMGAEDAGYYFQKVPGAYSNLGVAADMDNVVDVHNPRMKVDLNALEIGVRYHINAALTFLNAE